MHVCTTAIVSVRARASHACISLAGFRPLHLLLMWNWCFFRVRRIVPVKETHAIELGWPLPEQHSHYMAKPVSYLSHLFGHEGSGSMLSLLKVGL